MEAIIRKTNFVAVGLNLAIVILLTVFQVMAYLNFRSLDKLTNGTNAASSYLAVNGRTLVIPCIVIAFCFAGIYTELVRSEAAIPLNILPGSVIAAFFLFSYLRFSSLDGESRAGLIVSSVPVFVFTAAMIFSYLPEIRQYRNRKN